jgi:16S rRNA (cytosine967-C5)-methyltransferase
MERKNDASLAAAFRLAARQIAAVLDGASLQGFRAATVPEALRPQVHDLVLGALRRFGWGDFLIAQLIPRPSSDQELRALLLAAFYRLDSRPDLAHVVVHQAVEAAGGIARGRYSGLVNAVLRNARRRADELRAAAARHPEAGTWHPAWWVDELRAAYPLQWRDIVDAGNAQAPMCLRVNRRRSRVEDVLARFRAEGIETGPAGSWGIRLPRALPVERLPDFAAGTWSVQDVGAQRAAELLAPRDGERVLDACAAPGGKTAHLAELADLELLAIDSDAGRAARIDENLLRLGLKASVRVADAGSPGDWWDGRPFARILLDAPCTASGVVRRHPDAKWLRRPADIDAFVRQQARLLAALWPLLAPGGKLLYATCSVFPHENGRQVERFIAGHGDARAVSLAGAATGEPGLQLLPGPEHDGFFYALLEKLHR